ncbi:MAG: hypothetical protein IT510_00125 [Sulfuritalea sp.]|jgi:hypothetical protein|nr:hypothetical protein [Sulfuritalea sp.]
MAQARRRTRRSQFLPATAAGILLAGCTPIGVTDVSSSHYRLPAGTTVVVRQSITIPPGTAHVTLQDGQVVAIDRLRRYEPFCELEVNDVLDSEQQVRPGRFAATQIIRQQELGAKHPPALLAASTVTASESDTANATWTLASWDNPLRLNQVHFQLQSGAQPNVRELRCAGGWAFTSNIAYPTLAEMNRALGALVSIEIN